MEMGEGELVVVGLAEVFFVELFVIYLEPFQIDFDIFVVFLERSVLLGQLIQLILRLARLLDIVVDGFKYALDILFREIAVIDSAEVLAIFDNIDNFVDDLLVVLEAFAHLFYFLNQIFVLELVIHLAFDQHVDLTLRLFVRELVLLVELLQLLVELFQGFALLRHLLVILNSEWLCRNWRFHVDGIFLAVQVRFVEGRFGAALVAFGLVHGQKREERWTEAGREKERWRELSDTLNSEL